MALLFGTLWKLFLRLKNDTFAEDNVSPLATAHPSIAEFVPELLGAPCKVLDGDGRHCWCCASEAELKLCCCDSAKLCCEDTLRVLINGGFLIDVENANPRRSVALYKLKFKEAEPHEMKQR